MAFSSGLGAPPLPVDEDGVPVGTAENPLVVSGAPAGDATIVDGGDVCEGAIADAAATAGGTGTISAKLRRVTAQLDALATALTTLNATQASILVLLTDVYAAESHSINTT